MKFVKGISLFFVYPLFMLVLGFYAGVRLNSWFEPLPLQRPGEAAEQAETEQSRASAEESEPSEESEAEESYLEAANSAETLTVTTEYVLEERDIYRDTVVETSWRLPDKYVGMNREQFLDAMEEYEAFPPLAELRRGFVSLEVRSFSRERVVVRMNYRVVLPSSSFYLAAYDNKVVVLLDDRETIYIETDIALEDLPKEQREEIVNMMWIEDEAGLYDFLEAHSS